MSGNPYPHWAWQAGEELRMAEKFVLISVASFSHQDGCSWRAHGTIAKEISARNKKTVQRAIASLVEKGYVRRQPRYRANGSRTSDYLWLPPLDAEGKTVPHLWQDRSDLPPAFDVDGTPPRPPQDSVTPPGQKVQAPAPPTPWTKSPGPLDKKSRPDLPYRSSEEPKPLSASPTPADRSSSPKEELKEAETRRSSARKEAAERLSAVWNEHRGPLPEAQKIAPKRERALYRFASLAGSIGEAEEIMRKATIVVANDDFWIKNKYGLDNLLAGDKVFQRAETFDAEFEDSRIVEVVPGSRVAFKRMVGSRKETFRGLVKEVTDEQVVVHEDGFGGRTYRIPRRDVVEQI